MRKKDFLERYYRSRDGLRLYYRDYPTKTNGGALPVVCLHGLSRNSRDFDFLAAWLAQTRRVIAPDMRGRGLSAYDPSWTNYHPDQYVADVWTLLDELDIGQAIVVGTSLGGWMAAIMAFERPGAVAAAVINDVGPELDAAGLARIQAGVGLLSAVESWEEAVEQTRQFYALAFPDLPEEMWRWYTANTYREIGDGTIDLNYDRNIGVASRAGVSGLRDDPWILYDALLETPTLLLRGAMSDVLALATLEKMRGRYPALVTAIVKDRGHPPLLNEPEAINAISRFLESVDAN